MLIPSFLRSWISHIFACMSTCLTLKPDATLSKEEEEEDSFSRDFWSSSANAMDNNHTTPHTQPSQSQNNTATSPEFVNHALISWNEMRQQWSGCHARNHARHVQEPILSWNTTYEGLLGTNRPFPQLIPLSEMIEFLVDVWEQEGLYD